MVDVWTSKVGYKRLDKRKSSARQLVCTALLEGHCPPLTLRRGIDCGRQSNVQLNGALEPSQRPQ